MADAIERGLRQNLGLSWPAIRRHPSQGQLWQRRSALLPHLSARVSENAAQVDLAAAGLRERSSAKFPGFPLIVGPFGFFDVRATLTQSLVDMNAIDNARVGRTEPAAAKLSYQDLRELVVLVVGATYLADDRGRVARG